MTMAHLRVRFVFSILLAFVFMALTGCAGRHPAVGTKPNLALVGIWNWHSHKKGVDLTLVVYPLRGRSYLVQAVPFFTRRPLIGCGLAKAQVRRVDGQRYLFCQWMLPNLIDQAENIAALQKNLTADGGSRRSLVRAMIHSARETGLARTYFALRLDSISLKQIVITPLLGKNALGSLTLAEGIENTRKALVSFIRSSAGQQLAATQSRVFKRAAVKEALPVAFYTSP